MCQACGVEGEDRQDVFGKHSEDGVEDVDRQSVAAYVVIVWRRHAGDSCSILALKQKKHITQASTDSVPQSCKSR